MGKFSGDVEIIDSDDDIDEEGNAEREAGRKMRSVSVFEREQGRIHGYPSRVLVGKGHN